MPTYNDWSSSYVSTYDPSLSSQSITIDASKLAINSVPIGNTIEHQIEDKLKEYTEKVDQHVDELEEDIEYLNDKVTRLEHDIVILQDIVKTQKDQLDEQVRAFEKQKLL